MINRIVVVGGGITGLAAAHRLIQLGQKNVTLIEASGRLGGTIQTKNRDGFLIERGPDSFISEKPYAITLAQRLGLESQLIQTNEKHRRSFIVRNGRLQPVPEGFQLLAPSRLWPFLTTIKLSTCSQGTTQKMFRFSEWWPITIFLKTF